MANYQGVGNIFASFVADDDLTAKQYLLVNAASTRDYVKAGTSGSNPLPIGVLQNDPSAGQGALVAVLGFAKAKCRVMAACDLRMGRYLVGASDGFLEPIAVVGEIAIARYFGPTNTTGDASILADVLLFPALGGACVAETGTAF